MRWSSYLVRGLITFAVLAVLSLQSRDVDAQGKTKTPAAAPLKIKSLRLDTFSQEGVTVAGRDGFRQLVVLGIDDVGREVDVTRAVQYQLKPTEIATIDNAGYIEPRAEGTAKLTIQASAGVKLETTVTVKHLLHDLPVSFETQVVPVFTKFACNGGGCHGKSEGQNGFKLSLLGFEPAEDYEHLLMEAKGRRLSLAAPDQSLLLQKATSVLPHGGGKRIEPDSAYYKLLRRWIEQGAPRGGDTDPKVTRIEVFPREAILAPQASQQLLVVAHLDNGSIQDITRMAQFQANDTDLSDVAITGLVTAKERPGMAAVMVRYQSFVDVFRGLIPLGQKIEQLPPAVNFIDELAAKQWKKLGLPPSELADDGTFVRRATLDIAGRLPTLAEVTAFQEDTSADKYKKLIDRLLDSDDYAYYFASKWGAILRNRRSSSKEDPKPTAAFHRWIVDHLKQNKPYDQFVREVLTATGEEIKNPPVVWYREVNEVAEQLEDTAQLLLGQRVQCARCHHHPFEKWSQDDYYSFAAFFSRVEVKDPPAPKQDKKKDKDAPPPVKPPLTVSHKTGKATAENPKTKQSLRPAGLGGESLKLKDDEDPRLKLVDWMTEPSNPFFAKALANRYWKHFFGRGLVDPEDDMRATNPPSNPELLDALAKHFVDSKFDLKSLIRAICTSSVYRLSATPNDFNAEDKQNFSRFAPRRLPAEVFLDAIDTVTQTKTSFKGASVSRAVELPDNQVESYFLTVFGRPDFSSACECERSGDSSLAQLLHLLNSTEMLAKVNGGRASTLAKEKRTHQERLRELYLTALAREPSSNEMANLLAHLERKNGSQEAYADIVWAVINTKEFMFNH